MALPQRGQPVPGVLAEEAQRDVVGRPAPGLHREQLREQRGYGRAGSQQVPGAHAGGQQRLVGVAEGGIRDRHGASWARSSAANLSGPSSWSRCREPDAGTAVSAPVASSACRAGSGSFSTGAVATGNSQTHLNE